MARSTANSDIDNINEYKRIEIRHESSYRQSIPPPAQSFKLDSDEFRGFGIWSELYSELPSTYPRHIDTNESGERWHQSQPSRSLSDVPSQINSTPTPMHLKYLQPLVPEGTVRPEDARQLIKHANHRVKNRRSGGSEDHSNNSHYVSTSPCPSEGTDRTEYENEYEVERPRAYSDYFTPSHTPSHRSLGTIEEDDTVGQPPCSPGPFSSYNTYNAEPAKSAVASFDVSFKIPLKKRR